MSRNKINDMAIAREAQLMFTYTQGFAPIGSELNRWKGDIIVSSSSGERKIPIEVLVPLKYPEYPPKVMVLSKNIRHPNIEKNGNVLLNITHVWKPDVHVYQVIHALISLFMKIPPQFTDAQGDVRTIPQKAIVQSREAVITPNQQKVEDINETITALQEKIRIRDDELRKLRVELVKGTNETIIKIEDEDLVLSKDMDKNETLLLQAKSVALADLLSTLDEKFKDGEISPVDFAKLYRKYTKELYIVHKKMESN
ncbi:MAG TPA: ubiquitin-conjugating enzyme E2 [Candidatus Bathyarchaeia archaeon]|nr:ubiquitin-conjugating enzyme E2 [Candidatus Bathyarchaeia archaeon]